MPAVHLIDHASVPAWREGQVRGALVRQVDRDLNRWWKVGALHFRRYGERLILVRSLPPHVGGLHGVDRRGHAYAKVLYTPSDWNSTTLSASHELLEMLVDPSTLSTLGAACNPGAPTATPSNCEPLPLEIADPVNNVSYRVLGQEVSDFVTPAWFTHGPMPWDFLHRVHAAGDFAGGGYLPRIDPTARPAVVYDPRP